MSDELTSPSHLESLTKEAKRWLRRIRAGDADALARFRRSHPDAPAQPGLRDVQHALARERGFDGWRALKDNAGSTSASNSEVSSERALATLLRAANSGDLKEVSAVLDRHPGIINERGLLTGHSGMRTALHFAADGPHAAVMEHLLVRGADPNIRCEGDWAFPLHFIAERGRLDLVRLLIEHGADPIGTGDYHELEVIGWATAFENVEPNRELVDYLLAHGARHNIFSAVATGDTEAIRQLAATTPGEVEKRMDLTNHRRRPVHLAVVKRQPAALTILLELGADPNTLDESSLTPLDQAVLSGQLAMAQRLVDRGADLTLAAAVILERHDEVERLLAKDPDGLKPGHRWGTLIVRAAEYASGRTVERLLQLGASTDAMDDTKTSVDGTGRYTALHAAAWRGNIETVRALLAHGANPRIRDDKYCSTPAGWAAYAGHKETRDLILTGPIDIFDVITFDVIDRIDEIVSRDLDALNRPFASYATCDRGNSWLTPLAAAVLENKSDLARRLLRLGADPAIRAPDGRTLEQMAGEKGRELVAKVLSEHLGRTP